MFILTKISDTLPIVPADFEKRTRQALEDNINEKYANKVIQRIGLCICFYDLIRASDGLLDTRTSDGTVFVNAEFRLLVFRPFKGEILDGRIKASTPAGVRVTLAFFDDLLVPPANLFQPARYDAADAVFVWDAGEQEYFFDAGERVRLRVEDELWQDQAPTGRREVNLEGAAARAGQSVEPGAAAEGAAAGMGITEREEVKNRRAPWRIVASMQQGGLGVLEWW